MRSRRWSMNDEDDAEGEDTPKKTTPAVQLPTEGPFYVYMGPLQPGTTIENIKEFFGELDVVNVAVRGCIGRVELSTRDQLRRALFYDNRVLVGREQKVQLKPPQPPAPAPAPTAAAVARGPPRDRERRPRQDEGGNRGPLIPQRQPWGGQGERGQRDEHRPREGLGSRDGFRRDRPREDERHGQGGYGYRRDRDRERPYQPDTTAASTAAGRGEAEAQAQPPAVEKKEGAVEGQGQEAAEEGQQAPEQPPAEQPQRRRLQLKPRTKPVEEAKVEAARNPSIFGGGRPHDELEWEKKRKELGIEDKPPATEASSAATSNNKAKDRPAYREEKNYSHGPRKDGKFPEGHHNDKDKGAAPYRRRSDSFDKGRARSESWDRDKKPPRKSNDALKKEKPAKKPVNEDEWQEVVAEKHAAAQKALKDEGEKSEEGGPVSAPPRNVFSALTLEDEDD